MKHWDYGKLLIAGIFLFTLLQSQFYFGRNKVQYDTLTWRTLSTAHFDIYYPEKSGDIAAAGAVFAEDAFVEYAEKFRFTPEKRIPLVLFGDPIHFQQTNVLPSRIPEGVGGFFEFIKGRVVLPYTGSMWEFYHVVRHELVHVFMNHKIAHQLKEAKKWNRPPVPLWFSEGLAEWWSIKWDSQAEMVMRDALLYNRLVPLQRAGGFIVYKEGQSFLRYFEGRFGDDVLITLMETYWEYDSFPQAISKICGVKYGEIITDWEQSLKKEFSASLSREITPPSKKTTLTEGRISTSPVYYKDSSGENHAVFLSNREGYTHIFDGNIDRDVSRILVRGEQTADRESLHLLQTNISVNSKQQAVFSTLRKGRDALVIWNMERQTEMEALQDKHLVTLRNPQWSPDGEKIVFTGTDETGQEDIYLWEVAYHRLIQLTRDIYSDRDPAFSGDGSRVAFSSDRFNTTLSPNRGIVLIHLQTGEIYPLIIDGHENRHPKWDPENPHILHYISTRGGTNNIWRMNIASNTNKIQKIVKETNYHIGVVDFSIMASDSVLATLFVDYGFRIYSFSLSDLDSVEVQLNKPKSWLRPISIEPDSASPSKPYRLKYTFDLAQTMVAYDPYFGLLGGGQVALSDILGNQYYHFLFANSTQSTSDFLKRFNIAVTKVDLTRRLNVAVSAFYFANDYFDPYQAFFFEQSYGVRGGVNLPINTFKRVEISASVWRSVKDFHDKKINALLGSNTLSWVHDNTLWGPTGPIDGWRSRVTVAPVFDYSRGKLHNYTVFGDIRMYYRPLPKITLAHRTTILANDGVDIRRHYIGGSWGLRGYAFSGVFGRKYILMNNEIRFPIAKSFHVDGETVSLGFGPIRGALFLDGGNAWEENFPGFIGSAGIGIRVNFGGAVLRWDYGKRTDFNTVQAGWFSQFFFGWDF